MLFLSSILKMMHSLGYNILAYIVAGVWY